MSIYVISNELNIEKNHFKVGRTKDTTTEIVTTYQRYLSGARLLLWYPSTIIKYVEDEREILRFFDSNRNRTPNGVKNEWLSIPFEQLKTKMDEYFGHDGEEFEEEQKRERENRQKERENRQKEREERKTEKIITSFVCGYCKRIFTQNRNLKQHDERCKEKPIFILTEKHKEEIQQLKDQYENQIQVIQAQLYIQQQKIEEQQKQIEKLKIQNLRLYTTRRLTKKEA
jgi:hypothetical protein